LPSARVNAFYGIFYSYEVLRNHRRQFQETRLVFELSLSARTVSAQLEMNKPAPRTVLRSPHCSGTIRATSLGSAIETHEHKGHFKKLTESVSASHSLCGKGLVPDAKLVSDADFF
jgi:hypothetical protein